MQENYIFGSTYLKTIEKWLLDVTDIQRMIGAKNAKEALKVLEDTNYAREFKGIVSKIEAKDYRKILNDDLKSAKKLIDFLVKEKNLIKFLLSPYDFHNLKVLFKEKIFQIDLEKFLSPFGSQDPKELKKAIFEKKVAEIDEDFKKIIEKAKENLKEKADPFFLENYFEKEKVAYLLSLAQKMKSEWIKNYLKRKIDILNLTNIVRMYLLEKREKIKEVLIEGGEIKWDHLLFEKKDSLKEVLLIKKKEFEEKIRETINQYLHQENLKNLAKKLESLEREYLRSSRYIIAGPEIFVAYFIARENAAKNVRIIMEGKLSGLRNEDIQEMVIMPF